MRSKFGILRRLGSISKALFIYRHSSTVQAAGKDTELGPELVFTKDKAMTYKVGGIGLGCTEVPSDSECTVLDPYA